MTLFSTVKLEIAMPIAVISALVVGAVAAQQKKPERIPFEGRGGGAVPTIGMEEEEIEIEVAPAPEPEPLLLAAPVAEEEPIEVLAPPPVKPLEPAEELGTSKLELKVPEGAV